MATTSIWRVNGWLGKVLIYIENLDKPKTQISLKTGYGRQGGPASDVTIRHPAEENGKDCGGR
ncbi:MAG: hypothetical protein ACLSUM_14735 [Dysosmobacter welbionis]